MTPILVIDDEMQIRRLLRVYLQRSGYSVIEADSCASGKSMYAGSKPCLVLLDLCLPDGDGREILDYVRAHGDTPVIILSVRDAEEDIMALLDSGADDYIVKPFGVGELLARVRVALRHRMPTRKADEPLSVGRLELRLDLREARIDGAPEHLTPTEWSILELLIRNAGKIMTRKQIVREIWGPAIGEEYNSLRVYVNQLRKKIERDPSSPTALLTEPGVGYRLRMDA